MARRPAADWNKVSSFVISAVARGQQNIAKALREEFGVSHGTAHNYLRRLLKEGLIVRKSKGQYELSRTTTEFTHPVAGLEEHEVWATEIAPLLTGLPDTVVDIWNYGCTEMINNVIDHSASDFVVIRVERTPLMTDVTVYDRGVGIFRKIARAFNLEDDRHAVLELSKGKVTTDPANHTGEGIFFSSRAFDSFRILSGGVYFSHQQDDDADWILGDEDSEEEIMGTSVSMTLHNHSERRLADVFDEFATDTEDYRFDRTVVPVRLLQYGDDRLVSRSQAKRLLQRFDRFRTVILDFEDVETVGQAFADEVFRVFPSVHPEVEIIPINANEQVARMMNRATAGREPQIDLFAGPARPISDNQNDGS